MSILLTYKFAYGNITRPGTIGQTSPDLLTYQHMMSETGVSSNGVESESSKNNGSICRVLKSPTLNS